MKKGVYMHTVCILDASDRQSRRALSTSRDSWMSKMPPVVLRAVFDTWLSQLTKRSHPLLSFFLFLVFLLLVCLLSFSFFRSLRPSVTTALSYWNISAVDVEYVMWYISDVRAVPSMQGLCHVQDLNRMMKRKCWHPFSQEIYHSAVVFLYSYTDLYVHALCAQHQRVWGIAPTHSFLSTVCRFFFLFNLIINNKRKESQ